MARRDRSVPPPLGAAVVRQERRLIGTLAAWAGFCLVAGGPLWLGGRRRTAAGRAGIGGLLTGVGRQAVAWGAVDAAIAVWGASRSAPAPEQDGDARRRARRMGALTCANALADVGYVAGGVSMARAGRRRGDGAGIVVQGLFLLALDAFHTREFVRLAGSAPSVDRAERL